MSPVDNQDHLIRAQIQSFLPANNNSTLYTPEYAVTHFPGITYGFPRPPGELAGQPWFQPQCGVTQASLDPSKDREAQTFTAAQAASWSGNDEACAAIVSAAAVVVALVLVLSGGSSPYRLLMRVSDADGLRNGSPVVIGGVSVGSVHLDAHERFVTIELNLGRKYAPVGRNVTAAIVSQNVLGQKQVSLTAGDARRDPAASGYLIPAAQTSSSADLDQLLSTLDGPTRSRLAVIVNELGTAFYGRQLDFHQFITELVPALESGSNLLGQLASENAALGTLLQNTNAFVGSLAASRVQIADGLDALGLATQTIAGRQQALRATLHAAPGALFASA